MGRVLGVMTRWVLCLLELQSTGKLSNVMLIAFQRSSSHDAAGTTADEESQLKMEATINGNAALDMR